MKGYKVFHKDWTCRDKHYTCPGYFEEDVKPEICNTGMHFCERVTDCFKYYRFDSDYRVAEVEAVGEIDTDGEKSCTNKLKIIREIPWEEVLKLVNTGKNCTGIHNTGNGNAGYRNTGNLNTGSHNTGNYNVGDSNSGSCNTGFCNTGDYNAGWGNTGSCNTGSHNVGDWNYADWSSGCFCTGKQYIRMFDKESRWTRDDWTKSEACYLLKNCPINEDYSSKQKWWDGLNASEKKCIYSLPNFNARKFYICTGIKVDGYEISGE